MATISTIYGLVKLIGDNFGDDTNNRVSINVSPSNIKCNFKSATSTQIICHLGSSLVGDTKLLPISISVDDIYTQTYKPLMYCSERFYSTILFCGEYSRVKQLMIDNETMGATPNAPYIGEFESKMYQCFNQSLDIIGYEEFRFWQGVSNNSLYNIYDRTVSSNIKNVKYYTPLITFYTTDTPVIDSVTNIQFGQASLITIKGNHFGKDHSYVLIFFNEKDTNITLCKSPRFIGNSYRQMTCLLDGGLSNHVSDTSIMIRVAEKSTTLPLAQCTGDCNNRGRCNYLIGSCECDIGYDPDLDCSSLVM
ncbi:hypothetical protein DFA_07900 [Cavenderia fasciculata]|uniref:EGF-like domain-containing protein n=1 Tax=Cavenderia fasciculata TaxID=261658 RepID=F4Q405_CACFS|nr:uncharacterized protein DFA_07900 [Cavenderia fasciculata]EGG16919.1 hypothetical protein DFA_07900 [Cavenderia fasciculata]|eukprot:XP_004355393.1 hypothetical protein DFA_07900 [Cavenderia fasciculata]